MALRGGAEEEERPRRRKERARGIKVVVEVSEADGVADLAEMRGERRRDEERRMLKKRKVM